MNLEEKEKFQNAIREYEGQLLRYATRQMGDIETAREIVQDVFLRLLKTEQKEKVFEYLPQWLFTVCRNLVIDRKRKVYKIRQHRIVHILCQLLRCRSALCVLLSSTDLICEKVTAKTTF